MINTLLTGIEIENIVFHQVFAREEDKKAISPIISKKIEVFDHQKLGILQERITNVIGNESHCIEMGIRDFKSGTAFDLARTCILVSGDSFAEATGDFANKLTNAQIARTIPGGVLAVINGKIGDERSPFIAVIKAELHSGFNLEEKSGNLAIELLTKLFLTPQQKLYKVGIFILTSSSKITPFSPDDFAVYVFDQNMIKGDPNQAAQYFYDSFLGLEYRSSDKQLTRNFYSFTSEFINSLPIKSEERIDFKTSLYTYLKVQQQKIISVDDFSTNFLPVDLRDGYRDFMASKDFPLISINKDYSYITSELKQRQLRFTSDVKLIAPADKFSEIVHVLQKDGDKTIVEIKGSLINDK